MKITKFLIAVVLVVAMLVTAASAVYKPSAERQETPVRIVTKDGAYGYFSDTEGNIVGYIIEPWLLITYDQEEGAVSGAEDEMEYLPESVLQTISDMMAGNEDWKSEVPGFEEFWEKISSGSPLSHAEISDVFYAIWVNPQLVSKEYVVTFFVTADNINKDDTFGVLHYDTFTGEWNLVDSEIDEDNVIAITTNHVSPFAIVKDSLEAPQPTDNEPHSPQTGFETTPVIAVIASCTVLFAALAAAFVLKAKHSEN